MNIYSTIDIGAFHPVFCEDFKFVHQLNKNWLVTAVFDGCSAGKESHFASALFGKVLKKITQNIPYWDVKDDSLSLDKISIEVLGQLIIKNLFEEIKLIKNQLFLEFPELLSTYVLAVYQVKDKKVWINIAGDGVYAIDKQIQVIDQSDHPDYLAYHLQESFEDWYEKHTYTVAKKNVTDIAISTDGVLSFAKEMKEDVVVVDPVVYLLTDDTFVTNKNMIQRQCLFLEQEYELKPNDDIAIVRIINNEYSVSNEND